MARIHGVYQRVLWSPCGRANLMCMHACARRVSANATGQVMITCPVAEYRGCHRAMRRADLLHVDDFEQFVA